MNISETCDRIDDRLGAYLNTVIADCGIDGKGQYFRDLFAEFKRDVATILVESAITGHQQPQGKICEWKYKEFDGWTGYETLCGERVQSILDIGDMRFCPYCSRKLRPVR